MTTIKIWGIHRKYNALSWWENFMGGHISIGPLTIFGENAMHWAINFHTKRWGVVCLTLPLRCFGKYWGCHIYCSPSGTPWAATYYKSLWKEDRMNEEIRARIRKKNLGHNFNVNRNWSILQTINEKFDWTHVSLYDLKRFGPKKERGDYIPEENDRSRIV